MMTTMRLEMNHKMNLKLALAGLALTFSSGLYAQALFVAPTGDVGIGTDQPFTSLEVTRSDGTARILVSETTDVKGPRSLFEILNNGNPEFRMTNTGNDNSWSFSAGLRFVVKNNAGVWVSRITDTGDMEITGVLTDYAN